MVAVRRAPQGAPVTYSRSTNLLTAATLSFSREPGEGPNDEYENMIKPTPNPPETDPAETPEPLSPLDKDRLKQAAKKALEEHLRPLVNESRNSVDRGMQMFMVDPDINPEAIAIQTYETFSSVSILLLDLADSLDDKPRHLAMAIYQLSEMGLLLAEKVLDNERAIAIT
jgi:hypothetical protein